MGEVRQYDGLAIVLPRFDYHRTVTPRIFRSQRKCTGPNAVAYRYSYDFQCTYLFSILYTYITNYVKEIYFVRL